MCNAIGLLSTNLFNDLQCFWTIFFSSASSMGGHTSSLIVYWVAMDGRIGYRCLMVALDVDVDVDVDVDAGVGVGINFDGNVDSLRNVNDVKERHEGRRTFRIIVIWNILGSISTISY